MSTIRKDLDITPDEIKTLEARLQSASKDLETHQERYNQGMKKINRLESELGLTHPDVTSAWNLENEIYEQLQPIQDNVALLQRLVNILKYLQALK
jgi:hypothetical protein